MQALKSGQEVLATLARRFQELANLEDPVFLQWIPSSCSIPGNKKEDNLAKKGVHQLQEEYDLKMEILKTRMMTTMNSGPRPSAMLKTSASQCSVSCKFYAGRDCSVMKHKFNITGDRGFSGRSGSKGFKGQVGEIPPAQVGPPGLPGLRGFPGMFLKPDHKYCFE